MATVKLATLVIRVSPAKLSRALTPSLSSDVTDTCEAHLFAIKEPGKAVCAVVLFLCLFLFLFETFLGMKPSVRYVFLLLRGCIWPKLS